MERESQGSKQKYPTTSTINEIEIEDFCTQQLAIPLLNVVKETLSYLHKDTCTVYVI